MGTELQHLENSPAPAPASRDVLDILGVIENGMIGCVEGEGLRVPDKAEREILAFRKIEIDRFAEKPDRNAVASSVAALLALFNVGRARIDSGEAAKIVAGYTKVLAGLPLFSVQKACWTLARGDHGKVNPDFAPTAARLRQIAESYASPFWNERTRINAVLRLKLRHVPTAEERERVAGKFKKLVEKITDGAKDIAVISASADREEYESRADVQAIRDVQQRAKRKKSAANVGH